MNTLRASVLISLTLAIGLVSASMQAQPAGVPIESARNFVPKSLLDEAGALRDAGKLLTTEAITTQLARPVPAAIDLRKPRTKALRGREVATLARESMVHVGWLYLCPRCDHWHTQLSGGYAIARDTVATCHHCVEPDKTLIKEGYFIAVDAAGRVHPVTGVLAKSKTMDVALLRVSGAALTPLALSDRVAQGDAAYCLSDPLGNSGYLSAGIVNRFYWLRNPSSASESAEDLKWLRLNVSTDWAPGSSGAAVLDEFGNVIGHVSTISPLAEGPRAAPVKTPEDAPTTADSEKGGEKKAPKAAAPRDRFGGAVLITLHDAIPARGVLALAQGANAAAKTNSPALSRSTERSR